MVAGLGFGGVLVLAMMSGGLNSTDLAALIQPGHYFESRQIDTSIDRMIDIVITEPKTPKDQIMQLTGLRHLTDDADNFKKAKNYATNRLAIEEIAEGKRANDQQGFAKEYARRLLAKLDGKKAVAAPDRPLRDHALDWFPADVTFAGAVELSQPQETPNDSLKDMLKLMPNQAKLQMYDFIEKIGNLRLERMAFGIVGANQEKKIFVRFTGKANPSWLTNSLQTIPGAGLPSRQIKDAGVPVTLIKGNGEPIFMLIGDTDLMLVGVDQPNNKEDDLVAEVLAVRAKKKPNAASGPVKDHLAKVPKLASAFLVGELPGYLKKELGGGFDPLPTKIIGFIERTPLGLSIKVESTQANAAESAKLQQMLVNGLKQGVAELRTAMKQPLRLGRPQVPFLEMINLLENVQIQSNAERVQMRVLVPNNMIQQLGRMMMSVFG